MNTITLWYYGIGVNEVVLFEVILMLRFNEFSESVHIICVRKCRFVFHILLIVIYLEHYFL